MSSDAIKDVVDQNPGFQAWVKDYFEQNNLILTDKAYAAFAAWALASADETLEGAALPHSVKILSASPVTLVGFAVNLGSGETVAHSFIQALAESAVSYGSAEFLAAVGAGSCLIASGSVVVGYATANLIDFAWDRYLGPGADIKHDEIKKEYFFRVTGGSLSDFLRPRNGLLVDIGLADNVWEEYNLAQANQWVLKSGKDNEPLVVEYVNGTGFSFNGINVNSLRDLYDSSEEHKKVIDLILQNHGRDFEVSVNGAASSHHVTNYAARERTEIFNPAANGSGAEQQRTILALDKLLPFIEEGVDDYTTVDPAAYLEEHSEQYIEDRAAFLYYTMHEDEGSYTGSNIFFNDADLHQTARAGGQTNADMYLWGHGAGPGGAGNDHLYGGSGNDTLLGGGGNDRLEGGKGQDILWGQAGDDTFYVQGEDTAFDTFNGGEGTDTILGGDLDDTIRVNSLSLAENSIEVIDGGGGENIIAGTGDDNTIDLGGINVSHINRIEGGGGSDTITGTDHDDTLYGASGDGYDDWARDYLYGGAGNDAYYVGSHDIISDTDNQGIIWFKKKNKPVLFFASLKNIVGFDLRLLSVCLCASFLLGWICFCGVGVAAAAGDANGDAVSGQLARSEELAARAPKTPEEFLHLVREWMDDPYMDGYEFAERIIGVAREKWGPFNTAWGNRDFGPAYHMKNSGIHPPVPYQVIGLQITQNSNHLWDIIIHLPDKNFCVNAEMVRNILGEPNKISRKMPTKYSKKIPRYTPVIYFDYKNNKYELYVRFSFPETRFGNILKLPPEKYREIRSYIKNPDNDKYICASVVRFGTYEGQ